MAKTVFGTDRTALRRLYLQAWKTYRAGQPLEPLQAQIAAVIAEHPEYHPLLEDESRLDDDYTPEDGQGNPFLHMGMHLAIREQLATGRPAGISGLYQQLRSRDANTHATEHRIMECLGLILWEAQCKGTAVNEQAYLECLRKQC